MSWQAASIAILGLVLVVGIAWYERSKPTSKMLAMVATLAALAVLGRLAFAPLPNVKPATTDIVLLSGYVLGGAPAFAIGSTAALASNIVFSQGPWTPWQMAAWGLVGVFGAVLRRLFGRDLGRYSLALACLLAGLMFGMIMDFSTWATYSGQHTFAQLVAECISSLPFNIAHAAGNFVFCLAFGPAFVRTLERFRTRLDVRWSSARPAPNNLEAR
jgi:energy-coupling factor transport system substrate-specific component